VVKGGTPLVEIGEIIGRFDFDQGMFTGLGSSFNPNTLKRKANIPDFILSNFTLPEISL
jgi:hypothetical protein